MWQQNVKNRKTFTKSDEENAVNICRPPQCFKLTSRSNKWSIQCDWKCRFGGHWNVIQLKSLVNRLISRTDLLSEEWISWTINCSNWIFSTIFSTQVSKADVKLLGQFKTSFYFVSSSVQFGPKSRFAKIENFFAQIFADCKSKRCHSIQTFELLDTTVIDFPHLYTHVTTVVYTLLYTFRYIQYTSVYFSSKEHEP